MADGGLPISSTFVTRICAAREAALAKIEEAAGRIAEGHALAREATAMLAECNVARGFMDDRAAADAAGRLFTDFDPEASLVAYRKSLDIGVWTHLIDHSGMSDMMDRTAKEDFRKSFNGEVPEATEENVLATMQTLFADAGLIFRRGLANAFSKLDRRFRSHNGFKIGSRIILDRCFDDYGSWNYYARHDDTISDVERVFAVLDGNRPDASGLRAAINDSRGNGYGPRQSETETSYFRIRAFKNGNAHLWFTRDDLVEKANRELAAYYGEVIGDAADRSDEPDTFRQRSNLPAKNLQFFATPTPVVEALLRDLHITPDHLVLEPSAGEGGIAKAALERGAHVHAIEIHPERCRKLATLGSGITVFNANFLTFKAEPAYDYVLMNPPFAGTHWMDHVRHAFDLLKPGGQLFAVLPASAEVDESPKHLKFRRWAERADATRWGRMWRDLPAESFASVGTRVQTVILTMMRGGDCA